MARHAKDIVDCLIWVEDTPPLIVFQIQSDVISLGLTHVEWKFTTLSLSKKKKKKTSKLQKHRFLESQVAYKLAKK